MSRQNKTVSIIIPIYNTEQYVRSCVLSVLAQTYSDIEVLLIDDGSTDASLQICRDLALKDGRIKVFSQSNKGVSSARNLGIQMASGNLVVFVDSDDTIDKTMVESLRDILIANNGDIAVCGIKIVPEGIEPPETFATDTVRVLTRDDALKELLDEGIIANAPFGKLYKKNILQKIMFPEGVAIGEDLLTNYRYLAGVSRAVVESMPRYYYLQRDGSALHQPFSPKRMHGLQVTQDIFRDASAQSPAVRSAARGRLFMEAIYIMLTLPHSLELFQEAHEACKKVIKANAKSLVFARHSRRRNRLYGSVALMNTDLLIRLLRAERHIRGRADRKDNMKRVLVRHYSANNLGDDLFVKLLAERYKNTFSVILHTTNNSLKKLDNVEPHKNKLMSTLTYYLDKTAFGRNAWLRILAKKRDLMVYAGGSIFMEGDNFNEWLYEKRFYSRLKIPYYIIGANFGPYKTPAFFPIVKQIVSGAKDVCFRDSASYKLFDDCASARMASDIVFSLDTTKYVLKHDKLVVFSIIDCQGRFSGDIADRYEEEILKLTRMFMDDGYEVVYMSFCKVQGDEAAIQRILSKAGEETVHSITVHSYDGDIDRALALLARCEIVVGTRFHATILGLVFSKKVLPILYSKKTKEVLEDIGFTGPTLDLTDIEKIQDIDSGQIESFDVHKQVTNAKRQFEELDTVLEPRAQSV